VILSDRLKPSYEQKRYSTGQKILLGQALKSPINGYMTFTT